jgi:hypothetical protein
MSKKTKHINLLLNVGYINYYLIKKIIGNINKIYILLTVKSLKWK